MKDTKVINENGVINSLLVSVLGAIPSGDFKPGFNFLIKNITDENITVTIKPVGNKEVISTVLQSGWNPEICSEVIGVTADNTLQFGR